MIPEPADWMRLKRTVPEELSMLCDLCLKYSEQREEIMTLLPNIDGNDISKIQQLAHAIVEEYLMIMRKIEHTIKGGKEAIQRIITDIHGILTTFYDEKGRPKDLSHIFTYYKEKGQLSMAVPLFLAQIDSFIFSRIYNSIIEANNLFEKSIINKFIELSSKEAEE